MIITYSNNHHYLLLYILHSIVCTKSIISNTLNTLDILTCYFQSSFVVFYSIVYYALTLVNLYIPYISTAIFISFLTLNIQTLNAAQHCWFTAMKCKNKHH